MFQSLKDSPQSVPSHDRHNNVQSSTDSEKELMDIRITGRHIDISEAFRENVEARLQEGVSKYFPRSISANVTITKQNHLFLVDCNLHANQGVQLQSSGEASDAYAAFEQAAERIEKQLRRYKRRLKNHHNTTNRENWAVQQAQSYVLAPEEEDEQTSVDDTEDRPIIVAETSTNIPEVSVGDAVMLMDLNNASALMFRNSRSKELNVVYRRTDGNIGWIDPTPSR